MATAVITVARQLRRNMKTKKADADASAPFR
jgi:hypothetical protein